MKTFSNVASSQYIYIKCLFLSVKYLYCFQKISLTYEGGNKIIFLSAYFYACYKKSLEILNKCFT